MSYHSVVVRILGLALVAVLLFSGLPGRGEVIVHAPLHETILQAHPLQASNPISAVPEPATAMLLLVAMAAVFAARNGWE